MHYPIEHRATIYPTLWRPKDIKGIPRDYLLFLLIASAAVMGFLGMFGHVVGFVAGGAIFFAGAALGYFLARRDPEFLTIHLVSKIKVGKTRSREQGGNEYIA